MNDNLEDRTDALDQVFHYHDGTKHHYQRYAPGPGYLDWATQPNPFRRYAGARLLALERPPVTTACLRRSLLVCGARPLRGRDLHPKKAFLTPNVS